jgi:hypothetical protein
MFPVSLILSYANGAFSFSVGELRCLRHRLLLAGNAARSSSVLRAGKPSGAFTHILTMNIVNIDVLTVCSMDITRSELPTSHRCDLRGFPGGRTETDLTGNTERRHDVPKRGGAVRSLRPQISSPIRHCTIAVRNQAR